MMKLNTIIEIEIIEEKTEDNTINYIATHSELNVLLYNLFSIFFYINILLK